MRRWPASSVWPLLFTVAGLALSAAAAPKQVLILDSFGRDVAPFSATASTLRTTLARELGEPVNIDEVPLDTTLQDDPELEAAQAEYLQHIAVRRHFDLVVVVGSPAAQFTVRYRDRIFPATPLLFTVVASRLVSPETLGANSALLTHRIRLRGMVEDILQLAPATTNIAVVFGASPLEKFWAAACRREFQAFTNRVHFSWLDDLTLDQMCARVAGLPPHSFVLYGLLIVDAAGVPYNSDTGLNRLHAVANAPLYAYFQSEFGRGPIGGRLYPDETVGEEAARVAIRILRGTKPSDIPPRYIELPHPVYDWRELQRWHISEARLPAGSVIEFREPSLWTRYMWQIVGVVTLCLVEALLIFALSLNLVRRRRAERALRRGEERYRLLSDHLQAAMQIARLAYWNYDVLREEFTFNDQFYALLRTSAEKEGGYGMTLARYIHRFIHPDDAELVRVEMQRAVAAADPGYQRELDHRILFADGAPGSVAVHIRLEKDARGRTIRIYGASLDITDRKRVEEELTWSIRDVIDLKTTLEEHTILAVADPQGRIIHVNDKFCAVAGRSRAELVGRDCRVVDSGCHSAEFLGELWAALRTHHVWSGDLQIRAGDGSMHWLGTTIVPYLDRRGKPRQYVAISHDITERKDAEETARALSRRLITAQEEERARLARELHDDMTQRLARVAIDAGRIEQGTHSASPAETMRSIREELVRLSEDVHSLSHRLHPSLLEDLGLPEALKAECDRFSRQASLPVNVKLSDLPGMIPRDTALCLFRIAQGALANVVRHARARTAEVSLRSLDGGLQLAIRDDGVGFDPALPRRAPGLGLASMRERAQLLGGDLDTESAPGQGTTIVAWVPVQEKAKG
jgi:PAS domain S-box-containing protein